MTRMKSDQVNKNWAETLRRVREGGIVIIEHYKRAIAQLIPDDDTIVVLRVPDPGQAERLRRLVTEHGALGIPFPNNATPGWRVVDENGEPVNPHSIPSVAAELIPSEQEPAETTYAFVIEVSDDRESWMPENDEAMGTESFNGDPEKFADMILTNRLSDLEAEGGAVGYIRVVVWEGERQGYIGAAAAVVEPEEKYYEVLRARREQDT